MLQLFEVEDLSILYAFHETTKLGPYKVIFKMDLKKDDIEFNHDGKYEYEYVILN
jgi:hypothetical protein